MLGKLARFYIAGPEHPAKGRMVRWLGRRLMPERGVIGDAYPGVRMWLHPADWIELQLLRGIPYAPLTLDFLAANLRPGDTAILAGINNGLHAIVSARAVGAAGRVIGCEPQPEALLRTRANAALNDLAPGSLTLVAAALGSSAALTPLPWPPPHNRGAASFFAPGDGFVAPVLTLSTVARALGVGRLRLLLLVVQGCEDLALAGLGDLRPEVAIVANDAECAARAGRPRGDVHAALRRLGFGLYDARGEPFDAAGGAELPEGNLFCVRPETPVRWSRD